MVQGGTDILIEHDRIIRLEARITSLEAERDAALEALEEAQRQIAKWKASRIAFQDTVYAACNVVDAYLGSKVGLETLVEDELAVALESVLGSADKAQGKLEAVRVAADECGVACYVHTVLRGSKEEE